MKPQTRFPKYETIIQLIGWVFFLVGTGLFIVSSARSGDHLALAGSIAFLLGSLVFMAPLVAEVMQSVSGLFQIKIPPRMVRPVPIRPRSQRRRVSRLAK